MSSVLFENNGVSPRLKNKPELKEFFLGILKIEGIKFKKIVYIFTTDESLLKLNQHFLNHDTLTDILTFTLSSDGSPISSEIYISIDRVKENASIFKVSVYTELYRVMIHGILHLCGYSDHTAKLKAEMRKKEDFYLSKIYST